MALPPPSSHSVMKKGGDENSKHIRWAAKMVLAAVCLAFAPYHADCGWCQPWGQCPPGTELWAAGLPVHSLGGHSGSDCRGIFWMTLNIAATEMGSGHLRGCVSQFSGKTYKSKSKFYFWKPHYFKISLLGVFYDINSILKYIPSFLKLKNSLLLGVHAQNLC